MDYETLQLLGVERRALRRLRRKPCKLPEPVKRSLHSFGLVAMPYSGYGTDRVYTGFCELTDPGRRYFAWKRERLIRAIVDFFTRFLSGILTGILVTLIGTWLLGWLHIGTTPAAYQAQPSALQMTTVSVMPVANPSPYPKP